MYESIKEKNIQNNYWKNKEVSQKIANKFINLFIEEIQESIRPSLREDMYKRLPDKSQGYWRQERREKMIHWALEMESWLSRIGLYGTKKQHLKDEPSFWRNIEWVNEPDVKKIIKKELKEKFGICGAINIGRVSSFCEEKEPGQKIPPHRYIILAQKSKDEEYIFFMRAKLSTEEVGFFDCEIEGSKVIKLLLETDKEIFCPEVDRLVIGKRIYYLRKFVSGNYRIEPEGLDIKTTKKLAYLFGRAVAILFLMHSIS